MYKKNLMAKFKYCVYGKKARYLISNSEYKKAFRLYPKANYENIHFTVEAEST